MIKRKMKPKFTVLMILLLIGFSSSVYGQKWDMSGSKKGSKLIYKDGTIEYGKLIYNDKSLTIKYEDKTKKKVDINKVEKFEVYGKKDTTTYTYVLSERNYKKKKSKNTL